MSRSFAGNKIESANRCEDTQFVDLHLRDALFHIVDRKKGAFLTLLNNLQRDFFA
jgi:hypothetical protein